MDMIIQLINDMMKAPNWQTRPKCNEILKTLNELTFSKDVIKQSPIYMPTVNNLDKNKQDNREWQFFSI